MTFKIDFKGDKVIKWSKEQDKVKRETVKDYYPRFYINADIKELLNVRPWIAKKNKVKATKIEAWKPTLSKEETRVLRIDTLSEEALNKTVRSIINRYGRSSFRFYNVDLDPQFRFCIQKQVKPVNKGCTKIELSLDRKDLAQENLSQLEIDNEQVQGGEEKVLDKVEECFEQKDPDMVLVNRGRVLKILQDRLKQRDFWLGRDTGFEKLASGNTVSVYSKTVHSNARYNLPGRILIDKSNSFLYGETTLQGLWDLAGRSFRPLQELAWASIGTVLTSIETRKAYLEQNTLTPWKNWKPETPKNASKLHKADTGGFIFNPEPEIHRNVHECDFASLFPNIMVKKNISPETVNCNCCNNSKVPQLNYSICEKQKGFISQVLKPLVEDRQKMKQEIKNAENPQRKQYLQGSIDAIKWILVSCFGYMGHAHASYGSIECHQAIQAYDRKIMIKAKEIFEENGYKVVHGIIDSLWVQENSENPAPVKEVCKQITNEIGIKMEHEHSFKWVGFVPKKSTKANISTINRYFGKKQNNEYKTAGIEIEQDSTSCFVKEAQKEMLKSLDKELNPEEPIKVLKQYIERLENQKTDVKDLVISKTVSKNLSGYKVENLNVAALKRARVRGIDVKPGQEISYVVKDNSAGAEDRVRLGFEAERYDKSFYRQKLVKACESITSPFGIGKDEIENKLTGEFGHQV